MKKETIVVIVGAGPAGLATSACLNILSIPNVVLERATCYASLWQQRSYDRLKLHLAKNFCQLPHMPFPRDAPTFVSKCDFIRYLDDYISHFNIKPLYQRIVDSATYDETMGKWVVVANNAISGVAEEFLGIFLVIASGENNEAFIPRIPGLETFNGLVLHSSNFCNGSRFSNKDVLVIGCGNSGMEIAYDLSGWGAETSIVVRNPVHVLNKEIVQLGMTLLKIVPINIVDYVVLMLARLMYGDVSRYGLQKPNKGPFSLKKETGRSPIIDVGTVHKIKAGKIKVFPAIAKVEGDEVEFVNGRKSHFDAIVFATGYKSTVKQWFKDDRLLFDENGMPKQRNPYNWKGENGVYCAGFSRSGLLGISSDAKNISNDIFRIISGNKSLGYVPFGSKERKR